MIDPFTIKAYCCAGLVISTFALALFLGGVNAVVWWMVGAIGVAASWAIAELINIIPEERDERTTD